MVRKNNKKVGGKNDILIKPTKKEKKPNAKQPEVPLTGTEQLRLSGANPRLARNGKRAH